MNPRLFNRESPFHSLPRDVLLSICGLFNSAQATIISNVSVNFYNAIVEIWKKEYESRFGPLPYPLHAPEQFVAARLYEDAKNARKDIQNIYYIQLKKYLHPYRRHAWAKYYLGVMTLYGFGQSPNIREGVKRLAESVDGGDYLAAASMVRLLTIFNLGIECPQQIKDEFYTEERVDKMSLNLHAAYLKGSAVASFYLGLMFSHKWYEIHVENARLYLEQSLSVEDGIGIYALVSTYSFSTEETIHYYQSRAEQTVTPLVLGRIYFELFNLYTQIGQRETAKSYLINASQNRYGNAFFELGSSEENEAEPGGENQHESNARALNFYLEGMRLKDRDCTKSFFNLSLRMNALNNEIPPRNLLRIMQDTLVSGNDHAIRPVAKYLKRNLVLSDINANAIYTWWIQLAIQCGDGDSLNMLIFSCKEMPAGSINFYCALSFIYSFSTIIEANHQQALVYFNKAMKYPNSVKHYISTGLTTGLMHPTLYEELLKLPIIGNEIKTLMTPCPQTRKRPAP